MLTGRPKIAPKAPRKRTIWSTPGAKTSQKASKTVILPHVKRERVEVKFDDPELINSIALQPLSDEELESRLRALEQLKLDVIQDQSLPLRENLLEDDEESNWVFHRGAVNANLMIIGEGPGQQEAVAGKPFVGPSGNLLNTMLGKQGFNSDAHTFVTNLVYIRTSKRNRDPTWEEVAAYLPYVRRMVAIVRPKVILCLGALSSAVFSKGRAQYSRLL